MMTQVLDHADHELNVVQGGVLTKEGRRKPVRICLLAGAGIFRSPQVLACAKHIVDLLETMTTPVGHPDCEKECSLTILIRGYGVPRISIIYSAAMEA